MKPRLRYHPEVKAWYSVIHRSGKLIVIYIQGDSRLGIHPCHAGARTEDDVVFARMMR